MNRDGGYTRMLSAGPRPSDRAPMAIVELVGWKGDLREGMKRLAEEARGRRELKATSDGKV